MYPEYGFEMNLKKVLEIDRCPISMIDRESSGLIQIFNMCEGGMGGGGLLPSQLVEETAYYFTIRSIIISAQAKIVEANKPKD